MEQEKAREEAVGNVFLALNQLFVVGLLGLGQDAAEAITRIHAGGGKIRFEIELSPSPSLVCSAQRGDASVDVFRIESGPESFAFTPGEN